MNVCSRCDVMLDKIETAGLDGTNRSVVRSGPIVAHPYGLAYHSSYLFWTEYQHGALRRLDLRTGAITALAQESPPLFDLKVYDELAQTGEESLFSISYALFILFSTPP